MKQLTLCITLAALESALLAAKNVFPNEFIGLFRENEGVLNQLVIAPFSDYGRDFSSFSEWHLPLDPSITASFHSHPSWSNQPSKQDLLFFSKTFKHHFIACMPYSISSTACYDNRGKKIEFKAID